MSGDKHNPGYWRAGGDVGYGGIKGVRVYSADNYVLAVAIGDVPELHAKANARLIAAAPDLLEALEALFESYKSLADSGDAGFWALEDLEEGQAAIAAIRKAKGAFDPAPPKYPDKASSTPVDHISGQRIRERERRY